MSESGAPNGFLNIDKPAGMTSHDVVARIRRGLRVKKVGHAGTLDPMATGVLIVCVGTATRLSEYVMQSTKRYRARVRLGVTTDTYDADGEILAQTDASHISREDVERVLAPFVGDIAQVPPMYSAIKQGGRKLYKMARAGETVERAPRAVSIHRLEVSEWALPEFTLDVTCSAGTYIRSLAYDLGAALGVGAHLAGLERTASGVFTLDNTVSLAELLAAGDWRGLLVRPQEALDWPIVQLNDADADHVKHGRTFPAPDVPEGTLAMAVELDELVAVLRGDGGVWEAQKGFNAEMRPRPNAGQKLKKTIIFSRGAGKE